MSGYTTYMTVFDDQEGTTNEPIKVTFDYCADFTGDGYNDIRVTLDLTAVNPPNSHTEDMIGVVFDIAGDAVSGLTISGITRSTYFGSLSDFTPQTFIAANKIQTGGGPSYVDPGFNVQGADEPYDVGVKVSDVGSGEGIVQKFSFVLSKAGASLDAENLLDGTDWYVRLQSTNGGSGSAKTAERHIDLPPCGTSSELSPAIEIVKSTCNGTDDALLLPGSHFLWTYEVRNTGTDDPKVALSDIVITDDNGSPGIGDDDFHPTAVTVAGGYNFGDDNQDNLLDGDETWLFTYEGTAGDADYTNTATVTGSYAMNGETGTVSHTDDSGYTVAELPGLELTKEVLCDGEPSDSAYFLPGSTAAFVYALAALGGNVDVAVDLKDDNGTPDDGSDDFAPSPVTVLGGNGIDVFNVGDGDQDNRLDGDETWLYTGASVVPEGTSGQITNIAVAGGSFTDCAGETATVSADDTATYTVAELPRLELTKEVLCDGEPSDSAYFLPGSTAAFVYALAALGGNVDVAVDLKDDNGTPDDGSDDFAPSPVTVLGGNGIDVFNVGDGDQDNRLDGDETWLYTGASVVPEGTSGQITNIAVASGSFTDCAGVSASANATDDAAYTVAEPAIDVEKLVWGLDETSLQYRWLDADSADGSPFMPVGAAVYFLASVANTGNVAIAGDDVILSDLPLGSCPDGLSFVGLPAGGLNVGDTANPGILDPGETWYYSASTKAADDSVCGPCHGDDLTGSAAFTDCADVTATVTDADQAWYCAEGAGVRTPGFWKNWTEFWDGKPGLPSQAGQPCFPGGELIASGGKLVFVGDNLATPAVESLTCELTFDQALAVLSATPSSEGKDARYILGKDVITAYLNHLAGNALPDEYQEGVSWLITHGFPGKSGSKIAPSSAAWQAPEGVNPDSAATIHSILDYYNNTGIDEGVQIAADGDYCSLISGSAGPDYTLPFVFA